MNNSPRELALFDKFIKKISPKLGEGAAVEIVKVSQLMILIEMLVNKGIISREEFEINIGERLDRIAKDLNSHTP